MDLAVASKEILIEDFLLGLKEVVNYGIVMQYIFEAALRKHYSCTIGRTRKIEKSPHKINLEIC